MACRSRPLDGLSHTLRGDVRRSLDYSTGWTVQEHRTDALPGVRSAPEWFRSSYERLRVIARRELKRSRDSTLNTTELVHEVYLRMSTQADLGFAEARFFLSYAAIAMRRILIDRANRQLSVKFGFGVTHIDLTDSEAAPVSPDTLTALQLDAGLTALQAENERAAKVVELHYFVGLSMEEVGELLRVARRTIDRDWRYARAFLLSHIR